MENISHAYFYFLIFFLTALLLSVGALKFASFLSARLSGGSDDPVEDDGYSGGFFRLSPPGRHFPLKFSFIALLFVLFNAEFLLLLPWAMSLNLSKGEGFAVALFFTVFWVIGYFYEYKKGALEWK